MELYKCLGPLVDYLPYRRFLTVRIIVWTESIEGRVRVKSQDLSLLLDTEGKSRFIATNKIPEKKIKGSKRNIPEQKIQSDTQSVCVFHSNLMMSTHSVQQYVGHLTFSK